MKRALSFILILAMLLIILPPTVMAIEPWNNYPAKTLPRTHESNSDWFLWTIYPIYPDGVKSIYYDGDVLDFTGLRLIGIYYEVDAIDLSNPKEVELTNFTVSPPSGTIVHCSYDDEMVAIGVYISYEEDEMEYGFYDFLTVLPAVIVDNGDCGDNLWWTFYETGVLTIRGRGDMWDFTSENPAPWHGYKDTIKEVMFFGYDYGSGFSRNNSSVNLTSEQTEINSITKIGARAFQGCINLESIVFPENVSSIGDNAFIGCNHLTNASFLGNAPNSIGNNVFTDTAPSFTIYYYECADGWTTPVWNGYPTQELPCPHVNNSNLYLMYVIPIYPPDFKSVYYEGDILDFTGLRLIGVYLDLDELDFFNPIEIEITDFTVSPPNGTVVHCSYEDDIVMVRVSFLREETILGDDLLTVFPAVIVDDGDCGDNLCWTFYETGVLAIRGWGDMWDWTSENPAPWHEYRDLIVTVLFFGYEEYSDSTGLALNRKLTIMHLPGSLTSIGARAFMGCTSLESVVIPAGVTSIGDSAFSGCTGLASVIFKGNAPDSFGSGVFTDTAPGFKIYYSEGASGWSNPWNGYTTVMIVSSEPKVVVSSVTGRVSEEITLTISLENNPGITAMMFDVNYDDTALRITDTNANMRTSLLNGWNAQTSAVGRPSPIRFSWRDGLAEIDNDNDGVIVILMFEVITKDLGFFPVTVTLSEDNITNAALEEVYFNVIDGFVEVVAINYGDVNIPPDGRVTFADATLVERYVSGWSDINIDLLAADVNLDKRVNFTDATIIERHVAGWSGYETLPWLTQPPQSSFSVMGMSTAAAPNVVVEEVDGLIGEIVEVPIRLENNPGITAMMFDVIFDDSALRIADTNANMRTSLLNGWNAQTSVIGRPSPIRFSWRDGLAEIDNDNDGVIVILKFEIITDTPGVYPITLRLFDENITNANLDEVLFTACDGSITVLPPPVLQSIEITTPPNKQTYNVGEALDLTGLVVSAIFDNEAPQIVTNFNTDPEDGTVLNTLGPITVTVSYEGKTAYFTVEVVSGYIPGDVNDDGIVNMQDVIILQRYMARWPDYPESSINMLAADVNADGVVNMQDVVILQRHVARWPEYAILPHIQGGQQTFQPLTTALPLMSRVPSISVASAAGKSGETVKVPVSITQNPGITGMVVTLNYDNTALRLISYEDTKFLAGEMLPLFGSFPTVTFAWMNPIW